MNDTGAPCASHGRRHDLAKFLKAKRSEVAPDGFDLPLARKRRVRGLRREEVALLCGISTTWYTQLEAGTPITVSPALLSRLADVLRMSTLERAYLFALAIDELRDVVAFLPPMPALATRIEADTFEAEIEQVVRIHRALKLKIYGALVNDCIDALRPHLDETQCPIGFWLHEDLAPVRRNDREYDRAAHAHCAFHREIDRVVRASDLAGVASAERIVLATDGYASASHVLERAFADWPRTLAS